MSYPWDLPPIKITEVVIHDWSKFKSVGLLGDEIPACIRRDKNNRAPFMDFVNLAASPQASGQSVPPPWAAKS